MPVRDGFDAIRCIREHVREGDVPIMAMSTYPSMNERAATLTAGCSAFVAQPFDFDSLSALFHQLLPGPARPSSRGLVAA
jgi:CheY-like chemotaxis protein